MRKTKILECGGISLQSKICEKAMEEEEMMMDVSNAECLCHTLQLLITNTVIRKDCVQQSRK